MSVRKAFSALLAAALLSAAVPAQAPSPLASPAPATPAATPTDTAARQKELLDGIRERIKGRENEPAEKVFRNIELLRGKPASRLPGMMSALTGLLGVTCTTCHVPGRFESEELGPKRTAREHFKMQSALNKEYFGGANAISCWTCHRGAARPPIQ
jgi:Photosynthetic reaction centre cytochrome C subunit